MCSSVVDLASNFVGVEPVEELERWCGKENVRESIPCPQIVHQFKKAWEVATWWTCCYHCVKNRARQSAGTKRYSSRKRY